MVFANDYYPFGMAMPERSFDSPKYRFGFNGKEKDESGEWGSLTHYDYGFRIYNPGIGKFLSVDPLISTYPNLTPYQFASNSPIMASDLDGAESNLRIQSIVKSDVALEILNSRGIKSTIEIVQYAYLNQPWEVESSWRDLNSAATSIESADGSWYPNNSQAGETPFISNNIATSAPNGTKSTINLFGTRWKNGTWGGELEEYYIGSIEVPERLTPEPRNQPPGPLKKLGKILRNPGVLALELNVQASYKGMIIGGSGYYASDGWTPAINGGLEASADRSLNVSFNGNVLLSNDLSQKLTGESFKGFESNFSFDTPTPVGINLGGNFIQGDTYNGVGLNLSKLGLPNVSSGGTVTKLLSDDKQPPRP